jgi:hypothetical protein
VVEVPPNGELSLRPRAGELGGSGRPLPSGQEERNGDPRSSTRWSHLNAHLWQHTNETSGGKPGPAERLPRCADPWLNASGSSVPSGGSPARPSGTRGEGRQVESRRRPRRPRQIPPRSCPGWAAARSGSDSNIRRRGAKRQAIPVQRPSRTFRRKFAGLAGALERRHDPLRSCPRSRPRQDPFTFLGLKGELSLFGGSTTRRLDRAQPPLLGDARASRPARGGCVALAARGGEPAPAPARSGSRPP